MSYDVARVEFISALYRKIAGVTCRYDFTSPVEDADLDHVQRELSAAIPDDCTARVARDPDPRYVLVEVFWRGRPVYGRQMVVG